MKSTAIRSLSQIGIAPWGFTDDRRWLIADANNTLVTARKVDQLFTITARTRELDAIPADLELSAPECDPIMIMNPSGAPEEVRFHRKSVTGTPAGPAANAWLSDVLQRDGLRLMWCPDPTARALDPDYARAGDSTAYADGYPILLTSTSSLARLNDWIDQTALERGEEAPEPLPMRRFRPNIVVSGAEPFAEDGWTRVMINGLALRAAKDCDRCVMTTIDPDSLAHGKEPIRTLARHRRVGGKPMFGRLFIPEGHGELQVDDELVAVHR